MYTISVDDRILVARLLRRMLTELDPEGSHLIAVTGKEALYLVESFPIDVALLDVDMPGMNGLELARRIQAIRPRVNIIFVTGYEQYSLKAFELYASGYLLKPVTEKNLAEALAHLRYPVVSYRPERDGSEEALPDGRLPDQLSSQKETEGALPQKDQRTFGERLQSLRVARGFSQKQLAELVFVDRSSIAHWEGNRRIPNVAMINRLARAFDVSVTMLMDGISLEEEKTKT